MRRFDGGRRDCPCGSQTQLRQMRRPGIAVYYWQMTILLAVRLRERGLIVCFRRNQKLRAEPAEDIVHDRLGEAHIRVVGNAGRLEPGVRELVHQGLQWYA